MKTKKSRWSLTDDHLKMFARRLERNLARYEVDESEDSTARQKRQVETLIRLENEFRKALIKHSMGRSVYRDFIRYIKEERKNILAARPFFRERHGVFVDSLSPALKNENIRKLSTFSINYVFVSFVMSCRQWRPRSPVAVLARKISRARWELVEMNLPLAISRARLFWGRTRESHLEYMDLVQICVEGLIAGVDKFVLPYTPVWRSVAIGRMVGNMIEEYSQTLLHFYPGDKRKLYHANKAVGRAGAMGIDPDQLVSEVNSGLAQSSSTSVHEMADLMAASSPVSLVGKSCLNDRDDDERMDGDSYMADPSPGPDRLAENNEIVDMVKAAIQCLPMVERKLIAMKGVQFG